MTMVASTAASLALGNGHSCALLSTGEVKCWGTGEFGELGIRQMDTNQCADPSCVLTPVSVLTGASSISAGTDYTCAIVGNNVECIGSGLFGNLGLGNLFDSAVFTPEAADISSPRDTRDSQIR